MLRLSQKNASPNWLRQWIPISSIMLLATVLYLYQLNIRGLWIDEFISIIDAQKISFNRGRILYYILLHFWMQIGSSDSWLRGLAILFALGSVFLIYRLGRYLFGESTGLIAALLLALSPLFINHAQEVRYYTMGVCLGLAGTFALAHAMDNPTIISSRLWWAVTRLLAIITTPLNAALLFPDIALVGIKFYRQRSRAIAFGTTFLAIIAASIPAAISVRDSSGAHRLNPPIPGLKEVLRELRILTAFSYPPPPPYMTLFLQVFILILVIVLAIAIFQNRRSEKLIWVAAWAFIPAAIMFVFSHLFFSIWITRYLILICPYLLILLAVGFLEVWQKWRMGALALAVVYAIAVGNGLAYYYTEPTRYMGASDNHYRSIAETIEANEQSGDIIVFSIIHQTSLPLEHYYRGSAPVYFKKLISDKKKITRNK